MLALIGALALVAAACGGAAPPASSGAATQSAASTAAATASGSTSGERWTVTDASKATVSVREQLVGVSLPSDAVLVATGAKGSFATNKDGTFTGDSKISFDVTTLTSDSTQRDGFVKRGTLETSRFPTAELVPVKVTGLTLPLASSGTFTFTLAAKLTIHGVTKDVTFSVKAARNGGQLTATATAEPTLTFEQFGMTPPSAPARVVSVVDEIHLVVDLVATAS
jgi:polyisoprenoid-binding protein YceI